jgi:hypothetical protein
MPYDVGFADRLRIERLVWMLDQQLYDLPSKTRVATRREVRANLLEAARDVGTTEALRRVGGSTQLARQYLEGEFGEGPRHSWVTAAYVCALFPLLLNYVLAEAAYAFQAGVTATDPHVTGSFVAPGMSVLQSAATVTFTDGHASSLGGAWTPMAYGIWLVLTVVAGRLWRLPRLRRRQNGRSAAGAAS